MARKALLIGINRYRIPGADLRGCVNDVTNLSRVLVDLCGFAKGDIKVLIDENATQVAMQKGIRALVSGGRKGDVLLLHYSGHGANVPDADGDEADRRDEILCPHDLDWKKPLTDDWLRTTFDRLRVGVSMTVIMDCCHSGSNTRALFPPDAKRVPRYLPNPWDIMAEESGRKLRGKVQGSLRRASPAARTRGDAVTVDIPELLITGCRDTQTSADAHIGGSYNGALTYALTTVLREAKGRIGHRDLHAKVLAWLKREDFEQVPQLEGRKARLDGDFLAPLA